MVHWPRYLCGRKKGHGYNPGLQEDLPRLPAEQRARVYLVRPSEELVLHACGIHGCPARICGSHGYLVHILHGFRSVAGTFRTGRSLSHILRACFQSNAAAADKVADGGFHNQIPPEQDEDDTAVDNNLCCTLHIVLLRGRAQDAGNGGQDEAAVEAASWGGDKEDIPRDTSTVGDPDLAALSTWVLGGDLTMAGTLIYHFAPADVWPMAMQTK